MSVPHVTYDKPEPFRINVPQSDIDKVIQHARLTDFSKLEQGTLDHEPASPEAYGLPPKTFRALIEHLANGYDWRKHEKELNDLGDHYKVTLRGFPDEETLVCHYVVAKSKDAKAIPLLLPHGWPSSPGEFTKIVPLLTSGTPAFHVLMPSLPGYAWSGPLKKGTTLPWSTTKAAIAVDACMRAAFGENVKYVASGGDIGAITIRRMAQLFPTRLRAIHLNLVSLPDHLVLKQETRKKPATEEELHGLVSGAKWRATGTAYQAINSQVPYTLAAMLTSPVACIAYFGEKYFLRMTPSLDETLTQCLIPWFSGSIASMHWFYRFSWPGSDAAEVSTTRVEVPAGFSFGAHEIFWYPREDLEQLFDVRYYKILDKGSHFNAVEIPELLASEIRTFFDEHGKLE